MHGTRTTAKILVGAAVAALAGCVSVDAPPTAPVTAPAAETLRPGQEVAPQIVEGPALDALEAALPALPPSAAPRTTPPPDEHRGAAAQRRSEAPRPEVVPRQRAHPPHPAARPELAELPDLAALPGDPRVPRADVCALGERYGGWDPRGEPSGICHGTYGR
ncbi:hypothetical protein [Streptomyces sp. LMG1-1-1.1]|uniref:hypothetical protein n=1 Tax=Streptomyces sp. LMG1-1-1.1 TaxID=3135245 RepID=UPI003465E26E